MKMILTACLSLLLLGTAFVSAQDSPEVVVEPASFSDEELDQMLAPIALYPDTVLAHILIASTYPLEVVQAARWVERNSGLEGDDAIAAVEDEDWDPSVKALVAFPDLIKRMSDDLDWTQQLGDAFLDNEERMTDRIQVLRRHAYDQGNLKNLEHLEVVQEKEKIIIEPAVREVVYIPYYDTRYVYGPWWWDYYPPVYWSHPHYHSGINLYTSFYWGPRIHLSTGFFFSGFLWHDHHIVVVDHYRYPSYHYYSSRQVVHHHDAHRWHHNPQHRRGVDYYNARTRDYFESRKRNTASTRYNNDQNYSRSGSSVSRSDNNVARTARDSSQRKENLRYDSSRRNADYVRGRLQDSHSNSRSPTVSGANRGQRTESNYSGRSDANISRDQNASREQRVSRDAPTDIKSQRTERGNIKLSPQVENNSRSSDVRREQQPSVSSNKQHSNSRESVTREYRQSEPIQRSERSSSSREKDNSSSYRSNTSRQSNDRSNDRSSHSNSRSSRSSEKRER